MHPESVLWRVDREMVLLLGGGRALLMQLAHPEVAAGVADHSRFREDPLGRLYQTMDTMWSIAFDEKPKARQSLERLQRVHQSVRGTIGESDVLPAGAFYTAQDPDLLLWVHATLVDSALVTYERFVGLLSEQDKRQYYAETRRLAVLLGVPPSKVPSSLERFDDYMREMVACGVVSVGATARELADEILHPRPLVLRVGSPLSSFITVGLLPSPLREGYGLEWNAGRERMLTLLGHTVRRLLPLVPSAVRIVPRARAAERSCRSLATGGRTQAERESR